MPQKTQLQDVLEFTTLAAKTIQDISSASKVPFLGGAATLTLSIVEIIKSLKSSKDQYIEIAEQIQGILTAIIVLYESTQIQGIAPPVLLSNVVNFTKTLRKIHVHVKAKQGMGRFRQLLNLSENELQVKACKAELHETLATFSLQTSLSTVSTMFQMQIDAHEKHKTLMNFLANHPDIAYSDSASQVSGTLSGTTGSSPSISMLPPVPKIFHGRDFELQEVIELLRQDSPRIAILGPGGIGKTSLAQVALHHEDVVSKYPERYFVPCHSSATSSELISTISSHIGFESAKGLQHIIQYFSCSKPSLLVLDNFETLWEPASTRLDTEEFLSQLASVPQLAVLITMRGAEHPQKIKWTRPFLQPLTPLSNAAAWQVFAEIAEDQHELGKVQELLDITGNLPLAVSLMANVVGYEGCDRTLSRWNVENTHLLSNGYDQRSSLDISIMLSYSSSRMTCGAQELLSLLSMLPDGLSDADLVQSNLPLENILSCKSTLIKVSLAYVDNTKHLKCLVPVSQYIRRVHPPSLNLKYAFQKYLHQILSVGTYNPWNNPGNSDQVRGIAANCHNILSDALENFPLDFDATINSIAYLNRCLYLTTGRPCSDLIEKVWPKVANLPSTGKHGAVFYETLVASSVVSTSVDVMECIEVGNNYFKDAVKEEKCQWYYSLAYLNYRQNDVQKALYWSKLALSEVQENTSYIYLCLLNLTSFLLTAMGEAQQAIDLARRARQLGELLGDPLRQSQALSAEAQCQQCLGNLRCAEALSKAALRLCPSEREEIYKEYLAGTYLAKTEYKRAQDLALQVMDHWNSYKTSTNDTVVCHILLARIGIETGAEPDHIRHHIEAARLQLNSFVVWPIGLIHCDRLTADLHLCQGEISSAQEFANCLLSYQHSQDADGVEMILTRLADIKNGMHSHKATWRWAVILLAHGMTTKSKGAIAKALRCAGDLLIEDDEGSSLSVYWAALDTFTFMDVHRDKADCMVHIASIFEHRGERRNAVNILEEASSLYKRSSQKQEITKINAKLATLMSILRQQEAQLQRLAELNAPVGDPEQAQLEELGEIEDREVGSGYQAEGVLV
ncbi:hypothetical protein B0H14DRAFT_2863630 [Mycena olivaceomarginata]|nr:hypothetical protein B0H14DRAFT_2863630 [Mycena olivaceomarginata]